MSIKTVIACDACGNETNGEQTLKTKAEGIEVLGWESVNKLSDKKLSIRIEFEYDGKEDVHLCYSCLGEFAQGACSKMSESCDEEGDC